MAIYSLELMQRVGNHYVYSLAMKESYLSSAMFSGVSYDLTSQKPLMSREDKAGSNYVPLTSLTYHDYESSDQLASVTNVFDPFGAMSYAAPPTNVVNREGSRLIIDLRGWVSTATLASMLKVNNAMEHSVWELIVYQVKNEVWQRKYYTHPIIRLDFAVRSIHDDDTPDNWVGSKKPDLRFVVDPTDTAYKVECTDLLFDATKFFCETHRYAINGDTYRDLFIQKPYSAV